MGMCVLVISITIYFFAAGTPSELPCPVGTYNPDHSGASLDDCLPCVGGYYCLENSTTPTGPCDPGFYCPTGINNGQLNKTIGSYGPQQVACPGGTYQSNYTSATLHDCIVCPAGFSCVDGTRTPLECGLGHYCPAGSPYPIPCPVGTIGPNVGMETQEDCQPCPGVDIVIHLDW